MNTDRTLVAIETKDIEDISTFARGLALAMYANDKCTHCGEEFTESEIPTSITSHKNKRGRCAHVECWDAYPFPVSDDELRTRPVKPAYNEPLPITKKLNRDENGELWA